MSLSTRYFISKTKNHCTVYCREHYTKHFNLLKDEKNLCQRIWGKSRFGLFLALLSIKSKLNTAGQKRGGVLQPLCLGFKGPVASRLLVEAAWEKRGWDPELAVYFKTSVVILQYTEN